jgi:TonB family protein
MRSRNCHTCDPARLSPSALIAIAFVLAFGLVAPAQTPPGSAAPHSTASSAPSTKPAPTPKVEAIKEDELKPQLVGKTFYLRGEYFDDRLHFDTQGHLVGNSPKASYTLAMVQIDKINLSKHKLDLQGVRYGLHFVGAGPMDDPLHPSEVVRITPKKKFVKITIDRAEVVKSRKKSKYDRTEAASAAPSGSPSTPPPAPVPMNQAHVNAMLKQAIDSVLSPGIDERMVASLPDFWQLYFRAAAAKSDFHPDDHSALRQNTVDQKARLITSFIPPSNDFAQDAGVAGVAIYHVVVAPDGKPSEIAVGRPIGFGLDENAVASIRKASFQPAIKDGRPVPVLVDLVVEFRIFSKRTGTSGSPGGPAAQLAQPEAPSLPGPYAEPPAAKQP